MPLFLKSSVAIKLITGHIMHIIAIEIAAVIAKGLSFGVTTLKAIIWASLSMIKNSRINAAGHIIIISWNAKRNTSLDIIPVLRAIL